MKLNLIIDVFQIIQQFLFQIFQNKITQLKICQFWPTNIFSFVFDHYDWPFCYSTGRHGSKISLVVDENECIATADCRWKNETCVPEVYAKFANRNCLSTEDYCLCLLKLQLMHSSGAIVISKERCRFVDDCLWKNSECKRKPILQKIKPQCLEDESTYCSCAFKVQLKRERDASMRIVN